MSSQLRLVAPTLDPDRASGSKPGASVESSEERAGGAKRPEPPLRWEVTDLGSGSGSEVVHVSRFVSRETAWEWFDCLHKNIPWTRPTIRVFGRSVVQVRFCSVSH
jgi:DNA oxidative demethylase